MGGRGTLETLPCCCCHDSKPAPTSQRHNSGKWEPTRRSGGADHNKVSICNHHVDIILNHDLRFSGCTSAGRKRIHKQHCRAISNDVNRWHISQDDLSSGRWCCSAHGFRRSEPLPSGWRGLTAIGIHLLEQRHHVGMHQESGLARSPLASARISI